MLLSACDYFSRDERSGVLLRGDVLCKQDFWREEMVGLGSLQTIRSYEPHRQADLAGGFSILG